MVLNTNIPEEREQYLKKLYTDKGIKDLHIRLQTLIKLYAKGQVYPFTAKMFGFITLKIHSKQHHEGMIDELSQLLGKTEVVMEVQNGN